jgi:hypothetical protein
MSELNQEYWKIRQYLLGKLDEAGQQQVEERVVADSAYKEEVFIVEEELLEDYLSGELTPLERELFRRHYLSAPRQREKLKIAQALNKFAAKVSPPEPAKSHWLQAFLNSFRSQGRLVQLAAGALALVLIAGAWIFFQAWRTRSQQAALQAELTRLNDPRSFNPASDSSVLAVTFAPLLLREQGELTKLTITSETKIVQLHLPVTTDQYQRYRATLKVDGGAEVFKFEGVPERTIDQRKVLVLQLPSRILTTSDYLLTISALTSDGAFVDVADYPFRVLAPQ